MADPSITTFLMGEGYELDIHTTVSASPFPLGMQVNPDAEDASKRAVVRTAILLARPTKV